MPQLSHTICASGFFRDYRLRMAQVLRDDGPHDRIQAPTDSRTVHDTGQRCERCGSIASMTTGRPGRERHEATAGWVGWVHAAIGRYVWAHR